MSLAKILNKQRGKLIYKADSRLVLPDCLMGWEFEYEGVVSRTLPNHSFANHWQHHEERSLKDHGAEYVFAEPLFGEDFFNAVTWLMTYAQEQKWKCTKRAGIHVHLDVRDLEVQQLAGMCMVYAAMEPALYRWIGDSREVSHFCVPLYCSDEALERTCEIVRMAILDEKSGGNVTHKLSEGFERYAGFNLNALSKFGSVEFRHMQTTHDQQRVFDWANICQSIKASAFKLPHSDGSVIRMLDDMGSVDSLYYIFGKLADKLLTKHCDEDFRMGMESARDIAIHGTKSGWVSNKAPVGAHSGYQAWIKGKKKVKTLAEDYVEDLPHNDQEEEDQIPEGDNIEEPVGLAIGAGGRVAFAEIRDNALQHVAANWGEDLFRPAAAAVIPPVPPDIEALQVQARNARAQDRIRRLARLNVNVPPLRRR